MDKTELDGYDVKQLKSLLNKTPDGVMELFLNCKTTITEHLTQLRH
jgi:hypothetical protein